MKDQISIKIDRLWNVARYHPSVRYQIEGEDSVEKMREFLSGLLDIPIVVPEGKTSSKKKDYGFENTQERLFEEMIRLSIIRNDEQKKKVAQPSKGPAEDQSNVKTANIGTSKVVQETN